MLQFIPFEDDWDALERLRPEDLIPYRVGLLSEPVSPARPSTTLAVECHGKDAESLTASMAA